LGNKTNNQAEYLALIIGLLVLKKHVHSNDTVRIMADSELLVKQLNGIYKVKHSDLKPLHTLALSLITAMQGTICHVFRDQNTKADEMANEGIDKKIVVPADIIAILVNHGISL
jgi:ribonuclease HI